MTVESAGLCMRPLLWPGRAVSLAGSGRVEEIGLTVGAFAGHDCASSSRAGSVLEAVAAVPASDDHAGLAGESADEERAVGESVTRHGMTLTCRVSRLGTRGPRWRPGRQRRRQCGCSGPCARGRCRCRWGASRRPGCRSGCEVLARGRRTTDPPPSQVSAHGS